MTMVDDVLNRLLLRHVSWHGWPEDAAEIEEEDRESPKLGVVANCTDRDANIRSNPS